MTSLNIAFFVENRNMVHLAATIADHLPDDTRVHLVTADMRGEVLPHVEAGLEGVGLDLPVSNILDGVEPVSVDHVPARMAEWVTAHAIDRVVVFNDQSVRQARVMAGVREIVPTILVQDGQIAYQYRSRRLVPEFRSILFGASRPSLTCVWGTSTDHVVRYREPECASAIEVTGPVTAPLHELPELDDSVRRTVAAPEGGRTRVLLADQPLSQSALLPAQAHLRSLQAFAQAFEEHFDVYVKPHPSTSKVHLETLAEEFGERVLPVQRGISIDELRGYDAVLTFCSSLYLESLQAGIPAVFYSPPGLDVVFPKIQHRLFRNVVDSAEMREVAADLKAGRPIGNGEGFDLAYLVDTSTEAAARCADLIVGTDWCAGPERPAAEVPPSGPQLRELPSVVLGRPFDYSEPASTPTLALYESLRRPGDPVVTLVDATLFDSADALLARFDRTAITVASVLSFVDSDVATAALENAAVNGTRILLISTESLGVLDELRAPDQHRRLAAVLPHTTVVCGTDTAPLLTTLGAREVHTLRTADELAAVAVAAAGLPQPESSPVAPPAASPPPSRALPKGSAEVRKLRAGRTTASIATLLSNLRRDVLWKACQILSR